jgi:hypothetical protein
MQQTYLFIEINKFLEFYFFVKIGVLHTRARRPVKQKQGSINSHKKRGRKRKSSKIHNILGALTGPGGAEPLKRRARATRPCHRRGPLSRRLRVRRGSGSLLDGRMRCFGSTAAKTA